MKMVYICRNYAKNKNVLLFLRHNVYFRWHWYDDDDDNNNDNTSNSSEDIVSIIVSINRFTALSHTKLLIFGRFCIVEHSVKTAHLSNSLDKRLKVQGLPGRILTLFYMFLLFLVSYMAYQPVTVLLPSLSLFLSSAVPDPKIGLVWYFFSKQFQALWSGAQSISTTQSLVFFRCLWHSPYLPESFHFKGAVLLLVI